MYVEIEAPGRGSFRAGGGAMTSSSQQDPEEMENAYVRHDDDGGIVVEFLQVDELNPRHPESITLIVDGWKRVVMDGEVRQVRDSTHSALKNVKHRLGVDD